MGTAPHRKQRWLCETLEGRHRFSEAMPRFETPWHTCAECESVVEEWAGAPAPKMYGFSAAQVAQTLVRVASGQTYRSSAELIRNAARRPRSNTPTPNNNGRPNVAPNRHAQLVSDWVDTFTPMLWSRYGTHAWPGTVVIDAKEFRYQTPKGPRHGYVAFHVLAATGVVNGRSRPLRAVAVPADNGRNWASFLRSSPGSPSTIVSDGGGTIKTGIDEWQNCPGVSPPLRWRCEYHLADNLAKALPTRVVSFLKDNPDHELAVATKAAFRSPADWISFKKKLREHVERAPRVEKWLANNDQMLTAQTGMRSTYLGPYGNGSAERFLADIGLRIGDRAATFTNKTRLDKLLQLIILDLNGRADVSHWTEIIRDAVTALDGRPHKQRQHVECDSEPSLHRFRRQV